MRRQLGCRLLLLFQLLDELYRLGEVLLILHSLDLALSQVLFALLIQIIYSEVLGNDLIGVTDALHFLSVLFDDLAV